MSDLHAVDRALTLGISPCPNDVYIFAGLILGQIDWDGPPIAITYEDVESLNGRARREEFDIVKISYATYALVAEQYHLLPSGGALGRGVGPLLLRNGDHRLDTQEELLVPGEFTTANFLLDFYLRRSIRKRYLPFDKLYDELCNRPGAQGVVIHEKRFTYIQDGLTLIQDLGEYWEAQTGHPIPLGAIVARRALAVSPEKIDDLVRRSLAWADSHPEAAFALCREHAQDLHDGVIQAHIDLYVNDYSRDLGREGREAVAFFLAEQARRKKERFVEAAA